MRIKFRTQKLKRQYEDLREAEKAYGRDVAKRYIQRVDAVETAESIEALKRVSMFRCHPLKGDRRGEWAIKITGLYRLIFTLHGEQLEIARIEEVSKHYGID